MDRAGLITLEQARGAGLSFAEPEPRTCPHCGAALVPLGAALGLTLLAGSGPRIPISIVPVGSVQTDFETEFEACGINQTRHKVYLQLSASIRIVIPTGAKTTNVTANMLVAESIIVGKVPESFVGYRLSEEELNMAP